MHRTAPTALAVLLLCTPALAQDIDLTFTQPPVVMLAIDSSGSMQWRGTGIQRDDLAGITCKLGATEKSRGIVVKEVLTGTFSGYALSTTTANANDSSNSWDCTVGYHNPSYTGQAADGLLDTYKERLRFALASFDSVSASYNDGRGSGGQYDWSYPGTGSPVSQDGFAVQIAGTTTCTSCPSGTTCRYVTGSYNRWYCMGNVGARSLISTPCSPGATGCVCTSEGCMISAGPLGTDLNTQNALIQSKLLSYRSVGNTPIAAMLQDIRSWFDNHPDVKITEGADNFHKCRKYFTLLVTDGLPNQGCGYSDLTRTRPEVCFPQGTCTTDADCPGPESPREWFCRSASGGKACFHAAYDTFYLQGAVERAADLYNPKPGMGPNSIPVHVIGFDLPSAIRCNDSSTCPFGQTCQDFGGGIKRCSCATDANCEQGQSCEEVGGVRMCRLGGAVRAVAAAGGGQALFATDPTTLRQAINQIFSSLIPETTSRTRPTSTPWIASLAELPTRFPEPSAEALFLYQGAFVVPGGSPHWKGFLQRVSIGNKGTAASPVIGPITQAPGLHGTVRFDDLLNTQPKSVDDQGVAYDRKIYTYKNGVLTEFTKGQITAGDLGVASDAERNQIVDFVRGEVGSARATSRLGAIYHSSPVVLDPPVLNLALPSYQAYKANSRIRARPPMVFVGSNLGMFHAFNGRSGKEEWAFIPPILLPTLKEQLAGFTWGVDGTASVRDIQMSSLNETTDELRNWRAVAVAGVGYGARATFALDVTDPVYRAGNDPPFQFLWQFDDARSNPTNKLGIPFASAEVGTVFLDDASAGYPFQERAIAIIAGGKTPEDEEGSGRGDDLWVLDLSTGSILRRLDGTSGGGGMTGTCASVDDFPGAFITRAFCGDNQGKITRIDLADPVISNWTSVPTWFDLYEGVLPADPLAVYAAPALAFRQNGNLMVIAGNGDPNDIQSQQSSKLAFIEEVPSFDTGGVLTGYTAQARKIQTFTGGEKITGSPVVFAGVAYFTTFIPQAAESCSFGQTRLWGVQFDSFADDGSFRGKLESQCGPDKIIDTTDDASGTTDSCLLPTGSVSFGFDVIRTPSVASYTGGTVELGGSTGGAASSTSGGELKLVFQTGTAAISETSKLRDPQLTPPGAQKIQVGAMNLPDMAARTRVLSWGKVQSY